MPASPMSDQPRLHRIPANGITLACFEWNAERRGQGPTLLLVHATGFHARVWDATIAHLPDCHVLAVEQRGHGRSQDAPFENWEPFGRDLADLASALDLQAAFGIGHSMGAHALVQAAAHVPQRFGRLMLVDPVIRAPAEYCLHPLPTMPLHPSAGRRNRFESVQAMVERFADRPPYSVFTPQALRDYCQHGLRAADDGAGMVLACAPATEGRIYPLARHNPGIFASIRALRIPVTVLRVRDQDPSVRPWDALGSPTWPGLAAEFARGRDLHLADKTHMLPMEDPALMARLIREALDEPAPNALHAG